MGLMLAALRSPLARDKLVVVGLSVVSLSCFLAREDSLRPEAERGSPPSLTAEDYYARTLRDMGFAEHVAREAVRRADGRFELALDCCLLNA